MDKINDTTWGKEIKSNPKDRIEIIVGDDKQADFKPQVKIQRWDNEVNFSIRAEEKAGATIEEKDGVIKYITPEYEVHQYEKPNAGEDGGFEFEWVLNSLPSTNILTATIQTKELDFFYQGELTQEEIDAGSERPENVIGSYAVYHKTKRDNALGSKEYKTGKAFHIYRPKAADFNGTEEWCDLNIDETNGLLTVTIPQKFLDDAVYPVKVDPTFGYTSKGASSSSMEDTIIGSWAAPADNGSVGSITAYLNITTAAHTTKFALYNYTSTSDAGNLIAATAAGLIGTGDSTYTLNFSSPPSIVASTNYHILGWSESTIGANTLFWDTVSNGGLFSSVVYTGTFPSPLTSESSLNQRHSIYATYSLFTPTPMMHMMAQSGGLI